METSSETTSAETSEPATSREEPGGGEPCRAGQVKAALDPSALADMPPPDASGHSSTQVEFTNNGGVECTLQGYSEFVMVDAQGEPLPTDRLQKSGVPAETVSLPPGGSASTYLEWSIFDSEQRPGCYEPDLIRLTLPGDQERIAVPWRLGAYCGAITESPFVAS
ncbi:hypothetical protein GCM10010470_03870 [Saccharopolyspora taberi]|uniref:DUF4232 domain-containing protein n=1 Tax=Saccharopolyspora taberi TaxID=60895 RepID=A0ABN3V1R6_9PSEU